MLWRNKQQWNRIHTNIYVWGLNLNRGDLFWQNVASAGDTDSVFVQMAERPVPGHTNCCSLVFLCISLSFVPYFSLYVNTVVWQQAKDYPAGFTCVCGTQECINLLVGALGKCTLSVNLTVRRIEVSLSQHISFWLSQYNSWCLKRDTHTDCMKEVDIASRSEKRSQCTS